MLCELREKVPKKQGIENDICQLLETLETKKNLLLFFPYELQFKNELEFFDGTTQIQKALSNDFQWTMQYRHYVTSGFDTYMAVVYNGCIVFMEEIDNHFNYIDNVELYKSQVYLNLSRYGDVK